LAPGYIGWVAHDGEDTHVGVAGYRARFNPLASLNRFRTKISRIVDLSQAREVAQRGGRIPIGGILRRISNDQGLLIGDAAGAVSPLTAGGLDPCMRLSSFAADVVTEFFRTGETGVLRAYSGDKFRARFTSRLWARRVASSLSNPALIELGFGALATPLLKPLAQHIFFGRSSFPDLSSRFELENSKSLKAEV